MIALRHSRSIFPRQTGEARALPVKPLAPGLPCKHNRDMLERFAGVAAPGYGRGDSAGCRAGAYDKAIIGAAAFEG